MSNYFQKFNFFNNFCGNHFFLLAFVPLEFDSHFVSYVCCIYLLQLDCHLPHSNITWFRCLRSDTYSSTIIVSLATFVEFWTIIVIPPCVLPGPGYCTVRIGSRIRVPSTRLGTATRTTWYILWTNSKVPPDCETYKIEEHFKNFPKSYFEL